MKLGKDLMNFYNKMKTDIPSLNHVSFEITTYLGGRSELHGFYHIGEGCKQWRNISELIQIRNDAKSRRIKNEILFRKF